MSPQVVYALKRVAVLVAIAAVGVITENATGILTEAGMLGWAGIAMAALASAMRWLEGVRDADRAAQGKVIPADVAYNAVHTRPSYNGDKYV